MLRNTVEQAVMELLPLHALRGLREGLLKHTQRHSLEDHGVLRNTNLVRENGASDVP